MEITTFSDLATRRTYRATRAQHSGRLYVELLSPTHQRAGQEADLGYFATHSLSFLATIAAGMVEQGRAQFCACC